MNTTLVMKNCSYNNFDPAISGIILLMQIVAYSYSISLRQIKINLSFHFIIYLWDNPITICEQVQLFFQSLIAENKDCLL